MYLNRASDRTHWDGWASKAMFMRPDGKYTSRNFTIEAGDSLCAVVLVGYFYLCILFTPHVGMLSLGGGGCRDKYMRVCVCM